MSAIARGGDDFIARLTFGPIAARMGADWAAPRAGVTKTADDVAEIAAVGTSLRTMVSEAMDTPHLEEASPLLRQALRGTDELALVPSEQAFAPTADLGVAQLRERLLGIADALNGAIDAQRRGIPGEALGVTDQAGTWRATGSQLGA